MDHGKMIKQALSVYKAAFDSTFASITAVQDQTEKMMNLYLDNATWMPDEGKKAIIEWGKTYKKGRDDYKVTVDESYKKVEEFFANMDKPKGK
ncbi:MAG: hypothetical protein JW902_19140 [Syntrophaceae bacterium]|nr:hypothetical protein [Syntrophaceae bacterium]